MERSICGQQMLEAARRIEALEAELSEAQDKALRFDLDRAGIEQREREAVELVELRAERDRLMDIHAEVEVDHQHGPIVRVTIDGTSVGVYLLAETGVVTYPSGSQAGIEVKGPWWKLRAALKAMEDGK